MAKHITSQLTLTGFTRRAANAMLCVKPSSYFKRLAPKIKTCHMSNLGIYFTRAYF